MRFILFSVCLCTASCVSHGEKVDSIFPKPIGWVNDFEEILDSAVKVQLMDFIQKHQEKTSNQIAIVTVASIEPYDSFATYAIALSDHWGVGEKNKNNGLTIVFSKTLREVRISTGLGLEKKLSDAMCKKVIDEIMIPNFKEGKYSQGLIEGLKELIRLLELL